MSQTQRLTREFRYNGLTLPDLSPEMSVDQVREHYILTYPELRNASVKGPSLTDGKEVYDFTVALGTKG